MIIYGKAIANVPAYARLVPAAPPASREAAALDATEAFCRAWAPYYDIVYYCWDNYGQVRRVVAPGRRSSRYHDLHERTARQ